MTTVSAVFLAREGQLHVAVAIVQAVNWHLGKTHTLISAPTNSKCIYLRLHFYVHLKDFLADNFRYFPDVRSINPLPPKVRLTKVQKSVYESSLV